MYSELVRANDLRVCLTTYEYDKRGFHGLNDSIRDSFVLSVNNVDICLYLFNYMPFTFIFLS